MTLLMTNVNKVLIKQMRCKSR